MKKSIKKFQAALILVAVLAVLLAQAPKAYSNELTAQNKALSFITDVIQLDMTKYNATPEGYSIDYPPKLPGIAQEVVTYNLESKESKIEVTCIFMDNNLYCCLISVEKGSSLYVQPSANVLEMARELLQRYQKWTGTFDLKGMIDLLDTVDATKNMTATLGNVKLEVFNNAFSSVFEWKYTFNGADYTGIGMTFEEDTIIFWDDRSLYKIGNTDVNLSKEEAVSIALKRVENFSYKLNNGEEVTDFNIAEERITATLYTRQRETLTLYPYWAVELHLDRLYPGNVYAILVEIWTDTGEIFLCQPLGVSGSLPEVPTTEPPPDGSTGQTNLNPTPFIIAVPIVLAIAAVAIKKKRK